jgi:RNA polymerase sigma-70 factor (ECF subfamily)
MRAIGSVIRTGRGEDERVDESGGRLADFERERPRLRAVAYRMLGSMSDAEDAVQEAWLRLNRTDRAGIDNLAGWLTTVVGRVCIDMLRARTARRENYVGTWLPEPVVTLDGQDDPEQQALMADSVGVALLVVLDTLAPDERLAFVLHDMFGVPFDDIAAMIDRTPTAARQLASRARRRVRGSAPQPDTDLPRQRAVVEAFLAAARGGDFAALVELLHPDVTFRADVGTLRALAPAELHGAPEVARQVATAGPQFAPSCRVALVNGSYGMVVMRPVGPRAVAAMTIVDGLIYEIDLVLDQAKLPETVLRAAPTPR